MGQPVRRSSPRFAVSIMISGPVPAIRSAGAGSSRTAALRAIASLVEGETIGPDLSYANRHDRDFLLISLVDPTGVVRKEYQAYQLATKDGRVLSGLIVEQTPETITLRDAKGVRTQLASLGG